jgi:hypothetical protein
VYVTQRSENGIPVTRDADVAALPGECRVLDVPRGPRESRVVAAFEDRCCELDRRRLEAGHPTAGLDCALQAPAVVLAGKPGGDRRLRDGHAGVILRAENDDETPEREDAADEKEHPLEPSERGVTDIPESHGRGGTVDAAKYPGRVRTENFPPLPDCTSTLMR